MNQWWKIELGFGVYLGRNLHHLGTFVSLTLCGTDGQVLVSLLILPIPQPR